MGVKDGSKPRDDVRQGELDDAIFAASFGKLIRDEGPDIYRRADRFFQNTHPTAALSKLCRDSHFKADNSQTLTHHAGAPPGHPLPRLMVAMTSCLKADV
jgi:hypothetical protein